MVKFCSVAKNKHVSWNPPVFFKQTIFNAFPKEYSFFLKRKMSWEKIVSAPWRSLVCNGGVRLFLTSERLFCEKSLKLKFFEILGFSTIYQFKRKTVLIRKLPPPPLQTLPQIPQTGIILNETVCWYTTRKNLSCNYSAKFR